MYNVFQIVTKTAAEIFWRHYIVNFTNNVFINSNPYVYDQSKSLIQNASASIVTTRVGSTSKNLKQLWFICNEQRECDSNSYNTGGLGRYKSEGSKAKVTF